MPATAVSSNLTGNPILDAIDDGQHWSGTITYNRMDPASPDESSAFSADLPSAYTTDGLGLTDAMWSLVPQELALYRTYVAFDFAISDAPGANYLISDFYKASSPNTAGIAAEPGNGAILAFNRTTWDTYSDQQQQYIVLHELGHTLGLHHLNGMPPELDRAQYSIMSYDWYDLGDLDYGEGLPLTPMALDIAVLQAKYGASAANTGANTYQLSHVIEDTDGSDGLVQNGGGYVCIWDTGGADTLSYGFAVDTLLNLNAATLKTTAYAGDLADVINDVALNSHIFGGLSAAAKDEIANPIRTAGGFFSSFLDGDHREIGGYTIANGVQIEAASGGGGNDLLIGNELANVLKGNDGRDELFGGAGADSLDGGAGDDRVFGGTGADTITDSGGTNYLRGEDGADSIVGGTGFDDINGNAGNDTCVSGGGDDWVVGGKDNDSLVGSDGQNLVYGNLGSDTCDGGAGNDIVRGGQDNDSLMGGAGDDFVSGDKGDDTVSGGAGADVFHTFGDAGIDRVLDFHIVEGDRVQLDPGTQYSVAQVGADTVISMTGGGQMILVGVSMTTLTGAWIFGA